jgi:hypothetical protein
MVRVRGDNILLLGVRKAPDIAVLTRRAFSAMVEQLCGCMWRE